MIVRYRVVLDTRMGLTDVELSSTQGSEAAGRRAWLSLVHLRTYGDIDQVAVISSAAMCMWFAECENLADGTVTHPFLGEVPCCERCRSVAEKQKP